MGKNNVTTIKPVQRSIGVILGAAVGDALGAPFEFGPANEFSQTFPESTPSSGEEMIGGGGFCWAPGEFTDDNQMAMILAEHLINNPAFDKQKLWESWKSWSRNARDVGGTTSIGLSGTVAGEAAAENYLRAGRADGNGCLMRAHPVAVHSLGQGMSDADAMQLAYDQAVLTHGDPQSGWATAVYIMMLRAALSGRDPFTEVDDIVSLAPAEFRPRIAAALSPDYNPSTTVESSWRALGCLGNAVWAVRRSSGFHDAVVAAVDLGEDADTVGCVAGALAGAIYGVQAIPARWTNRLNGRVDADGVARVYDFRDLTAMAYTLSGIPERPHSVRETHAGPAEVADGLFAASLPSAREADGSFAVVSLCRTDSEMSRFARHREFFIIDSDDPVDNPSLDLVIEEVLATIDQWHAEGLDVLVHCHGGRSRTALVLAEWAMRKFGFSGEAAADWVDEVWPRAMWWNSEFCSRLGLSREPVASFW